MEERRAPRPPSGFAMEKKLNVEQRMTLHQMESFGWELRFVRQPLFQEPVPVLFDAESNRYAVLEEDGNLNREHGLTIRAEDG